MVDQQLYHEAANKLHTDIQQLIAGSDFSQFNHIALHNIYLLTSFLYYQYNEIVISDNKFDALCKYILDNFDDFELVVRHKEHTLIRDRLTAGTGFDIKITPIWYGIVEHYRRTGSVESRQNPVKIVKEVKSRKQMSFF